MRYVCFLRAINVGGRNITMAELKRVFVEMGLESVETFIASGNVVFDSEKKPVVLEKLISANLEKSLGYPVPSFLRTIPDLTEIANGGSFEDEAVSTAVAHNVAFAGDSLTKLQQERVAECRTGMDDFSCRRSEIYWLCKVRQSDSRFSSQNLERRLGTPITWRGINTVRRLVAKYGESEEVRRK